MINENNEDKRAITEKYYYKAITQGLRSMLIDDFDMKDPRFTLMFSEKTEGGEEEERNLVLIMSMPKDEAIEAMIYSLKKIATDEDEDEQPVGDLELELES